MLALATDEFLKKSGAKCESFHVGSFNKDTV